MPEMHYDGSQDPDFIAQLEAEQAENEQIGDTILNEEKGLLAGKFQSAEELERGYIELQKLLGKKGSDQSQEDDTEQASDEEQVEEQVDEVPFVERLAAEFAQYGQLTQETYDELSQYNAAEVAELLLQAQGLNQEQPQSRALTDQEQRAVQDLVGGPQEYAQMTAWAQQNLDQGEIDAYNEVMDSGDLKAIYFAINAINARYQADVGYDGKLIDRTRPSSSRGDVFRSQAEVQRAMADPRYDSDPAYRQDVFEKLERSTDLSYD